MFLKERQNIIASMINEKGRVAVAELAEKFSVTVDCIRKDLRQLESQGLAKRVYGGAISVRNTPEKTVYKRFDTNSKDKQIIAEKAYELIRPGDIIFLDISTTVLELAKLLKNGQKRCVVVSNMMDSLHALAENPLLSVICPGGRVSLDLNGFVGALTISNLVPMTFDKAFIGAISVDMQSGDVTTFELDDGLVKRKAIESADVSYLMVDNQKFSSNGNYRFAKINDFDGIITTQIGKKEEKSLETYDIELI